MNDQSVSRVKDCEVTVHIAASILRFWAGPLLTEAELRVPHAEECSNADGRCNSSFAANFIIMYLPKKKKASALGSDLWT